MMGIDPLDAKDAQRQAQRVFVAKGRTFRECALEFIEKNRAAWRNAKHRQQWENTLATYAYPTLGELPVAAIDTGLVVQVLDPIWAEKPETASRVRGRIAKRPLTNHVGVDGPRRHRLCQTAGLLQLQPREAVR